MQTSSFNSAHIIPSAFAGSSHHHVVTVSHTLAAQPKTIDKRDEEK